MAGYVIGAGCLAFVLWQWWRDRVPAGAVRLAGVVVSEEHRVSSRPGRSSRTYAPRVSYTHPRTGASALLEPSLFTQRRWSADDDVELVYDPARDHVRMPQPDKTRMTVVLGLVGVGFVVLEAIG